MFLSSKLKSILFISALISFCILVSLPILNAGFYGDDAINSLITGHAELNHQTIWQTSWFIIKDWFGSGRLNSVSLISTYALFHNFPNVVDYQIVRVIFIWLSIFSFAWLIKLITKQTNVALLFLFLVPVFWSTRDFFDPLTSYALVLPLTGIFCALALVFFIKYIEKQNRYSLYFSLLCYLCALFTYEISVLVLFSVVFLAWIYVRRNFFLAIIPYLILSLAYLICSFVLHLSSDHVYDGIKLGVPSKFFTTFWYQLTATFPLSYRFMAREPFVNTSDLVHQFIADPWRIFLMVYLFVAVVMCFSFLTLRLTLQNNSRKSLFFLGLCALFIPAFLVGMSQKYQDILRMGVGYLPLYIQSFGLACLVLVLLEKIKNRAVIVLVAIVFGLTINFSLMLNSFVVNKLNEGMKLPRLLEESAIQHGIMANVPAEIILFEKPAPWHAPEFYMQHAHVRAAIISKLSEIPSNKNNVYYLEYSQPDHTARAQILFGYLTQVKNKIVLQNLKIY